jgi:hypothetical protein
MRRLDPKPLSGGLSTRLPPIASKTASKAPANQKSWCWGGRTRTSEWRIQSSLGRVALPGKSLAGAEMYGHGRTPKGTAGQGNYPQNYPHRSRPLGPRRAVPRSTLAGRHQARGGGHWGRAGPPKGAGEAGGLGVWPPEPTPVTAPYLPPPHGVRSATRLAASAPQGGGRQPGQAPQLTNTGERWGSPGHGRGSGLRGGSASPPPGRPD